MDGSQPPGWFASHILRGSLGSLGSLGSPGSLGPRPNRRASSASQTTFVERFNASTKDEHLCREEITNGQELVDEIQGYRDVFNTIRPHEALGFRRPLDAYLSEPTYDLFRATTVKES